MAVDKRSQLLDKLMGQIIEIPDLYPVFPKWPGIESENINPFRMDMIAVANCWLEA